MLANRCLGNHARAPHGVYRALVIRGFLSPGEYELTDEGRKALGLCQLLNRQLRRGLLEYEAEHSRRG